MGAIITSRRDRELDFLKGVAIVLMVLGHALVDWPKGDYVQRFIYLFHMPVFFMASGYCFDGNKVANYGVWRFVRSRVIRLWGVYVLWVWLFLLLDNVFLTWNIYTSNPDIHTFVPGMSDVHHTMTFMEIVKHGMFTIPMIYRPEPVSPFWFIKSLFVVSICYAVIELLLRRFVLHTFAGQTIIATGMLVLFKYHPGGRFETLMFYLGGGGTFYGWFLFHVGRSIREKRLGMSFSYSANSLAVALLTLILIQNSVGCWKGPFMGPEWLYLPSFVICSVAGWVLLLSMAKLAKWVHVGGYAIIEYIGTHTMPILILHLMAFKVINFIGVLITGDPIFVVAGFPASYHGWVWTVIYTVAGVAIPLALEYLWRRGKTKLMRYKMH